MPAKYSFVFESVTVTSKQEGKLTVGECVKIVDGKNIISIIAHPQIDFTTDSNIIIS